MIEAFQIVFAQLEYTCRGNFQKLHVSSVPSFPKMTELLAVAFHSVRLQHQKQKSTSLGSLDNLQQDPIPCALNLKRSKWWLVILLDSRLMNEKFKVLRYLPLSFLTHLQRSFSEMYLVEIFNRNLLSLLTYRPLSES